MKNSLTIFLLALSTNLLHGQLRLAEAESVVLDSDGVPLLNAFAGGINAGQFYSLELNGDALVDLVVFDRTANKLSTFLQTESGFVYSPRYEYRFPKNLMNWIVLADYDCDGQNDLFTSTNLGIKVYKNLRESATDTLSWELVADPILTEASTIINLFVNSTDLPAIHDVDQDGDLDILVFNFATGGFVEYHQNQSIENSGTCDQLEFQRITRTWGDFQECFCGSFAFGEDECPPGNRIEHVAGKALTLHDLDADGLSDVFFGEELCPSLFALPNSGTAKDALIRQAEVFYSATASELLFPAAFFQPVSLLGTESMIMSSNSRTNSAEMQDFSKSVYLFEKTNGAFQLSTNSFLQADMIEVGENATPAFGDIDQDGDADLILGNKGTLTNSVLTGSLRFYRNIGANVGSIFQQEDLELPGFTTNGLSYLKPEFHDMNADGVDEMLLSAFDGSQNKLYIFKGSQSGFVEAPTEVTFPLNQLDNFSFADVNQDGMPDLLGGTSSGRLDLYLNEGSGLNPNFILTTRAYFGIDTNPSRTNLALEVITVGPEQVDLLLYDNSGEIRRIEDFVNSESQPETLILEEVGHPTRLGRLGSLAAARINGSSNFSLLLGNVQGGVQLLMLSSSETTEDDQWNVTLYPNPASNYFRINSTMSAIGALYDISGRLIRSQLKISAGKNMEITSSHLQSGLYVLHLTNPDGSEKALKIMIDN